MRDETGRGDDGKRPRGNDMRNDPRNERKDLFMKKMLWTLTSAAALLCVAFGAMTLLMLLPAVGEYAVQIRDFLSELSLEAVYGQTMLKAMGIVLMTQFAAQVCRDMDAPSIACRAELCGRLMLLGVALPIFLKLTQMAVGALQ